MRGPLPTHSLMALTEDSDAMEDEVDEPDDSSDEDFGAPKRRKGGGKGKPPLAHPRATPPKPKRSTSTPNKVLGVQNMSF